MTKIIFKKNILQVIDYQYLKGHIVKNNYCTAFLLLLPSPNLQIKDKIAV
jgi:hypothetical protein